MWLLVLACLALAGAVAAHRVGADLRPVGVDHLGARDRPRRPRDHARAVVEAAAGDVHDAVLAARRRRRARAVARRRARRRAAGVRDGVPPRRAAGRPVGGRDRRRRRSCSPTSSSATSRAATPRACWSALVLWAVERHLDGRRSHAFLLGFAAALLRPEVWPFWGLYGLWLVYQAWDGAPPWREIALVFGSGALALVLWFLPEYLGSGDWLRAASRARDPNPDSAAFAAFPFAEVFRRSAAVLMVPVYVGAAIATAVALWRARHAADRARRDGHDPDGRGRADDAGRLRRQPALHRAAGRAGLRARRCGMGGAGARRAPALERGRRCRRGGGGDRGAGSRSWRTTTRRCARTGI